MNKNTQLYLAASAIAKLSPSANGTCHHLVNLLLSCDDAPELTDEEAEAAACLFDFLTDAAPDLACPVDERQAAAHAANTARKAAIERLRADGIYGD